MDRASTRRAQARRGVDREAGSRSRHESSVQIRKEKKDKQLKQRRKMEGDGNTTSEPTPNNTPNNTPHVTAVMRERLAQIPAMVAGINSPDPAMRYEATVAFRRILSIEQHPPIDEVIRGGVVPKLVEFIKQTESHELQFEAAWALTNIASGTTEHTSVVIDAGAIPVFADLLDSPNVDVREQATWALGNITGDSVRYRDMVLNTGVLPKLVSLLEPGVSKLSLLRNATWTLSNFCRGKPQPPFSVVAQALPPLAHLVTMKDTDILTDACWGLSYLSDGKNDRIEAVVQSGCCKRLVELLMHPAHLVQTPALRAVGNIVTGNDAQTQIIIDLGALHCLQHLLSSPKRTIVKEACWTISNITAGDHTQIQAVIDANLIPPLIELVKTAEFDIRKEASWALSNLTSGGTSAQIKYLVNQGCIPPLCDLLVQPDTKVILVALDGLENILKVGELEQKNSGAAENEFARYIDAAEGLEKIEWLQLHSNVEVFQKATRIMEQYFGYEDEEELEGFVGGPGVQQQQPGGNQQQQGFNQNPAPQGGGGFNFGNLH